MGIISSIAGFFTSSSGVSLAGVCLAAILMSFMHSCDMRKAEAKIGQLESKNHNLELANSRLASSNQGFAASFSALLARVEADNQLVAKAAAQREALAAQNRILNHQLSEAIKHEKPATINTILSDDLTRALCLRFRSASGLLAAGADSGASARAAHPRADHSGSAASANCAEWQGRLSLGAVIEWSGALLDHAGDERLDKAALRRRNAKIKAGERKTLPDGGMRVSALNDAGGFAGFTPANIVTPRRGN